VSLEGSDIIALYDRHARDLVGFFARRTGDPELALDLLAAADELHDRVSTALEDLSVEQGQAIRSRVVGERSYAEVAQDLGVSEQAARARVSRGLQTLRRVLAPSQKGAS
jgi:RNA polymerase sigma-70 factor, ECF subfamily